MDTRGRFHQTFFAKRQFAGAQLSVKNLLFNFTIIRTQTALKFAPFFELKFAELVRRLLNLCTIC